MRSQVEAARIEVDRSVGVETRCGDLREVGGKRKETEQSNILSAQHAEGSEEEAFVDAVTEQPKSSEEDAVDLADHYQKSDQVESDVVIPSKRGDGNLVAKHNIADATSSKPTSSAQKFKKLKALKENGNVEEERKVGAESEEKEEDMESHDVSKCVLIR